MNKIVIAGIGTEVGKTVVSAIITTKLLGDYWKPIQSGIENSDTDEVAKFIDLSKHKIFPPTYSLKAPLSPHHAARLEGIAIDLKKIIPPKTNKPLIIEMAGGIFTPINHHTLNIDLFSSWKATWILVSKNYLGSINHTLLTIEALQTRNIPLLGIIFNGKSNPDTENTILEISKIPVLGRLLPESQINQSITQRYAKKWQL